MEASTGRLSGGLFPGAAWWVGAELPQEMSGWRLMKGTGASVWGSGSSCHAHVHF